jgi:hypothetical protein
VCVCVVFVWCVWSVVGVCYSVCVYVVYVCVVCACSARACCAVCVCGVGVCDQCVWVCG